MVLLEPAYPIQLPHPPRHLIQHHVIAFDSPNHAHHPPSYRFPATQPTLKETLAQLSTIAKRASTPSPSNAAKPADILVLPEAYLGGYPRGSSFGCAVGGRTAEGRDEFLEYFKAAVDLGDIVGDAGAGAGDAWVRREIGGKRAAAPGGGAGRDREQDEVRGDGTREELERIARDTGVFLVVGLVERAGGSLYCAVVYVCPTNGILGKRRKVLPRTPHLGPRLPATLKAVSTTIRGVRVNLAAAICWENYMPLVRQALYAQNVNLYLAPTADQRDTWLGLMRTVGIEGRCFVVSSNMCVRRRAAANPRLGLAPTSPFPATRRRRAEKTAPASTRTTNTNATARLGLGGYPARKNSILCEDGNEIALPAPRNGGEDGFPTAPKKNPRRLSIPCGDGMDIIVPAPADPPTRPRTNSVLLEDGNEIANQPSSSPLRKVPGQGKTAHERQGEAAQEWASRGGSSIISPFGEVLAGPQWEDDEGIIYADVDFDDCIRGRLDLDTAGSYSRNDSFKFSVQGLDLEALPY
ncbi:unnamed protein product [Parascedosporium putredinis]|uniref:CN hydrolase domain-containing protein n=1 Tax=Parascedosporium putredinis TaxID=1442378 RepID=A0A9P1ME41_9PEZI|nr:unnamed protein product [Parascedosporium putredinis]CAI7999752.1 unnamed protein product [Parascedosporium putredinis]